MHEPGGGPGVPISEPVASEPVPGEGDAPVSGGPSSVRGAGAYPPGTIGRLMETAVAVYPPEMTVREVVDALRTVIRTTFVTYVYVVDAERRLVGVVAMRELLFAGPEQRLDEVMLRDPFALTPDLPILEAMRRVLHRHYPIYPVVDRAGVLVGALRGQALFEAEAIEISAQPGRMVGVESEERLATPLSRSFRLRHPWLQFNLFTAFLAAAVVGLFQSTINQIILLAAFLPVMSGQSQNTGAQALAVTLRGITLGELTPERTHRAILREGILGVVNGAAVGITAGLGMAAFAYSQQRPDALHLGLLVAAAMVGSCGLSGIAGAAVPIVLRRLGIDPASAAMIFLSTVSDVASMAIFLGLARWLVT